MTAACKTYAEGSFVVDESFEYKNIRQLLQVVRTDASRQLSDIRQLQNWASDLDIAPLADDQALWGKFQLHYEHTKGQRYSLIISNPNLDIVDVYILDKRGRIRSSFNVGAARPFSNRPTHYRSFAIPMELIPGDDLDVYLRFKDDGPMVFALEYWQHSHFSVSENINLVTIGLVSGGLLAAFLYFLATYVILRSPIRFWFSVSTLCFALLFLNIEGVIGQISGLSAYISLITTLSIALATFASAKVAYMVLQGVPLVWRALSYTSAVLVAVLAFTLDSYWQIITTTVVCAINVSLQLFLSISYRNQHDSLPNRLYAIGWVIIAMTALTSITFYLSGISLSMPYSLIYIILMLTGIMIIAVAIEVHEEIITKFRQQKQGDLINDLRQFYDMFKNSAEGLYSASLDGELITTNPAMCKLFGYEDEAEMLAEVKNTRDQYSNPQERDILVGRLLENEATSGIEVKLIRKDGSIFWGSVSAHIREEQDRKLLYGSINDITERKQSDINMEYMATHDSLTGVYNRREFEKRLRKALEQAKRNNTLLTLLYMDLDQFKIVNDSCGHKAGDILIKQLSQQLNQAISEKGILARLGGDEFGVLLEGEFADTAFLTANKLLNTVKEFRFIWDNRIFSIGISIGLVPYKETVATTEQLMSMADAACYTAKEQGRNQIHTYSDENEHIQRYESELAWVNHINKALEDDRFELFYQHYIPLKTIASGHRYEILLRMRNQEDEIVPPAAFLPAAERYDLTAKIDKWVIENTFKWFSNNRQHLDELARCNINLT
jgi:diguanylate cyclase (GGDEF)-like protein/PAS domain S-box-containing protein